MNENPLTNLFFFAHDHAGFDQFMVGQVRGCIAPGWFIFSVGIQGDTSLSVATYTVSVEQMHRWAFFPTLEDARQCKAECKKARRF